MPHSLLAHIIGTQPCTSPHHHHRPQHLFSPKTKYFLAFDSQDYQATQESFLECQGINPLSPGEDKKRS